MSLHLHCKKMDIAVVYETTAYQCLHALGHGTHHSFSISDWEPFLPEYINLAQIINGMQNNLACVNSTLGKSIFHLVLSEKNKLFPYIIFMYICIELCSLLRLHFDTIPGLSKVKMETVKIYEETTEVVREKKSITNQLQQHSVMVWLDLGCFFLCQVTLSNFIWSLGKHHFISLNKADFHTVKGMREKLSVTPDCEKLTPDQTNRQSFISFHSLSLERITVTRCICKIIVYIPECTLKLNPEL